MRLIFIIILILGLGNRGKCQTDSDLFRPLVEMCLQAKTVEQCFAQLVSSSHFMGNIVRSKSKDVTIVGCFYDQSIAVSFIQNKVGIVIEFTDGLSFEHFLVQAKSAYPRLRDRNLLPGDRRVVWWDYYIERPKILNISFSKWREENGVSYLLELTPSYDVKPTGFTN